MTILSSPTIETQEGGISQEMYLRIDASWFVRTKFRTYSRGFSVLSVNALFPFQGAGLAWFKKKIVQSAGRRWAPSGNMSSASTLS